MKKPVAAVVGLVLIAILALFNTTYSIAFHEVGVKTRFGKIEEVVSEPGQHWKMPFFIERVAKLDTRLQLLNSSEDTVATRDTQQVIVQAFLFWRVSKDHAREFANAYDSLAAGSKHLQDQLQSALRGGIGKFTFDELIGEGGNLRAAEDAILAELKTNSIQGAELVSVGISQLVLPAKTTVAVLRRMEGEQRGIANNERAAGAAEADGIRAQATSAADKIRAFADERATQIKAQGDKEASQFYKTMKDGESLAMFLAWLRAFEASLSNKSTVILDTTRPPWHLMDPSTPVGPDGIPVARNDWEPPVPAANPVGAAPARKATPGTPGKPATPATPGNPGTPAAPSNPVAPAVSVAPATQPMKETAGG